MWYYLVKYSFDADKPVFGPFHSYEDAWNNALNDAQNEYDIDRNENGWNADMNADYGCGEIVLVDHFIDRDDTTEWIVFEIDNTKLM